MGELTQVVPPELVDAVLEETGTRERRLRELPSRVGVYFVLALGLFEHLGARLVWGKLVVGLSGRVPDPSEKALRDLRRRIGATPLKRLFEVLAGPLAQPSTPGVCYRRWRTVAFDGCRSLAVPDHERNRAWLGQFSHRFGPDGYPKLTVMALCETGTRGLLAACFGPVTQSESAYARQLVNHLTADMLVLADRAFGGNDLLAAVSGRGAQFLVRCTSSRRFPVLALLPDGSYLTRVAGLSLRVVEAEVQAHTADGGRITGSYSLTDHRVDPAERLVGLYHERWEVESSFLALRHTLLKGRVLRSKDPAGVKQELWGLLVLYQALRSAMVMAVETVAGCDPDRAAFIAALEAARDTVIHLRLPSPTPALDGRVDLVGRIGAVILDTLLPPRRLRVSARVVKCGISRYHTWKRDDRPLKCTRVTAFGISVQPPALPTALTMSGPDAQGRPGLWTQVSAIMAADTGRSWSAQDLAQQLGITGRKPVHSLGVALAKWARKGLLDRIARATYKLTQPDILTSASVP